MIRYVGDLSEADAALLERYAGRARSVLEFGAGGSTQIIAQAMPARGTLTTVETDPQWTALTTDRLRKLGVAPDRCTFTRYEEWRKSLRKRAFDLVFVDGLAGERGRFALNAWPLLSFGGFMLFHDTRRAKDIANVATLFQRHFESIGEIRVNESIAGRTSNITAVRRKPRERYVNWKRTEAKPAWRYGTGDVPESFWRST